MPDIIEYLLNQGGAEGDFTRQLADELRRKQLLGEMAAGGPARAAAVGKAGILDVVNQRQMAQKGAEAYIGQAGPLAQATASLHRAQAENLPAALAELSRHQQASEQTQRWLAAVQQQLANQARYVPVQTPEGGTFMFDTRRQALVPMNPVAEALKPGGRPVNPGTVPPPAPAPGPEAAPPAPGAVPIPRAPVPATGAAHPPTIRQKILSDPTIPNPQETLGFVEKGMIMKLPQDVQQLIVNGQEGMEKLQRVMDKIDQNPGAFGYSEDWSAYLPPFETLHPLTKAISVGQQANRNPVDTQARTEVFESVGGVMHDMAGARGFQPQEMTGLEQRFMPTTTDNAATIKAKLAAFYNNIAGKRNNAKNEYLQGLHNQTTDTPFLQVDKTGKVNIPGRPETREEKLKRLGVK